ncbi:plasma kallikrein-like [Pelobates fuscus]|uniref:plasma kallikrein-like n=1 Tax=Pelobates fuscus TaxID=191477 RepID=UPI002FE48FFF
MSWLCRIFCCVVIFPLISGECISALEKDVYIKGGDYSSVFAPDVEYCQSVCTFNPRCLMFSYLPGDWARQNEKFACFLKDGAKDKLPKVNLAGAISGHSLKNCNNRINVCRNKMFPGIEMMGTNYNIINATDENQCQEMCTNDIHCQFFSYVTHTFHSVKLRHVCYFKYSSKGMPNKIRLLDNVISGFSLKHCGKSNLGCKRDLFQSAEFSAENLISVIAPDVHICQKICTFYPNCLFFTFLKKEWRTPSQRNLCYLKTSKTGLPNDVTVIEDAISGFSLLTCKTSPTVCPLQTFNDMDFLGTDLLVQEVDGENECQQLCSKTTQCQFFTYKPVQSSCTENKCKCYLKMSNNGLPTGILHGKGANSGFSLRLCRNRAITGCGQPVEPENRIVGGEDSSLGEWPWQVSMQLRMPGNVIHHACGGSIISNQWILTAAHCVSDYYQPRAWNIYGGFLKLSNISLTTPKFEIDQIIIHPLYKVAESGYDLALLKLKTPISFTDHVQAICLPPQDNSLVIPNSCWITGWGYTVEDGQAENVLQKAEVPIVPQKECQANYSPEKINDKVICAGYKQGKVDACKGDSGGPIACKVDNTWYLFGITSWGEGCAKARKPGVYTRVTVFANWIEEQIKLNQ